MVETLTATDETRAADLPASIDIGGSADDEFNRPYICDVVAAINSFLEHGGIARAARAEALLRARKSRGLGLIATQHGLQSALSEIKYSQKGELANITYTELIARAEEIDPTKELRPDTSELVLPMDINHEEIDRNNQLAKEIDAALERGDLVAALELQWQLDENAPTINVLSSAEHLYLQLDDGHPSKTETIELIRRTATKIADQCQCNGPAIKLRTEDVQSLVEAATISEDPSLAARVAQLVASSTANLRAEEADRFRRAVTPYIGTEPVALAA